MTSKVFSSLGSLPKPPRGNRTCLFDICFGLANNGVGRRVTRAAWHNATNNYVTLTRVAIHEAPRSFLKRGTAYGILTWNGVPEAAERRLTSTCKRDWFFAASEPVFVSIPKTDATNATTPPPAATARQ